VFWRILQSSRVLTVISRYLAEGLHSVISEEPIWAAAGYVIPHICNVFSSQLVVRQIIRIKPQFKSARTTGRRLDLV